MRESRWAHVETVEERERTGARPVSPDQEPVITAQGWRTYGGRFIVLGDIKPFKPRFVVKPGEKLEALAWFQAHQTATPEQLEAQGKHHKGGGLWA